MDDSGVTQHLNGEAYHLQVPQEIPMPLHAYVSQQQPNLTLFHFNHSVIKFIQWQMELTHSTQHFHQQTMDASQNIARSSTFQENQHFIITHQFSKLRTHSHWRLAKNNMIK